jgi:hypothetical protein
MSVSLDWRHDLGRWSDFTIGVVPFPVMNSTLVAKGAAQRLTPPLAAPLFGRGEQARRRGSPRCRGRLMN